MLSRCRCLGLEMISSLSWDGLKTHQLVSTKNDNFSVSGGWRLVSSRLFTSGAQDVIFDQIMQATLIKWAKSVVAIYGSVNPNRLMHYLLTLCIIIIINGREEKFTSAIIVTCRPVLTSRRRLVTYKHLVLVLAAEANISVSSRVITACTHPCLPNMQIMSSVPVNYFRWRMWR